MRKIGQMGDIVHVHHNPDMETCCVKTCGAVLFGPVYRLRLIEPPHPPFKEWLLCSKDCYAYLNDKLDEAFAEWAGDDFVAIIDDGIPDEWD